SDAGLFGAGMGSSSPASEMLHKTRSLSSLSLSSFREPLYNPTSRMRCDKMASQGGGLIGTMVMRSSVPPAALIVVSASLVWYRFLGLDGSEFSGGCVSLPRLD